MKVWLKIIICAVVLILLCLLIDIICIYTVYKPIFAVKQNDSLYYGIFYNTYVCPQYSVPQIKAKWNKYSCSDVTSFEIIDTTEVCAEALEGIYKDETGEYYLPCIKSQNISIKFSDGTTYSLKYVLENKLLTIHELIDAGLDAIKY